MDESELRPCPFCGKAVEFERRGDRRQSCIVVCSECGARHESGDTWNSGSSWNRRAEPAMPDPSFLRTVTRVPALAAIGLAAKEEADAVRQAGCSFVLLLVEVSRSGVRVTPTAYGAR